MKNNLLKLFVNAIAFVGITQFAQAQVPANNSCFNAAVLTVNAPYTTGTTTNATLDGPVAADCWGTVPDKDVWYTFTTGAAGIYTITTDNGISIDMQVKIFSGACGALTLVACNEDVGTNGLNTLAAVASASLTASTTYYVQVDRRGLGTGTFLIALRFVGNDNCSNATPITVNSGCVIGSNYGATVEAGEDTLAGCWTNAANATVWYSFTTGAAGAYTVSTNNGIPNTNTQIKIYSAPCGTAIQQVACNENGAQTPNTLAAIAFASLAASSTYFVQVDLNGNKIGSFCINVSLLLNDNCSNAIPLTVNVPCTNGNNFGATIEVGENITPTCWSLGEAVPLVDHTVWYTFTTGTAGTYTISTDNGGTFDSQLMLYDSCGSSVVVGCDDDGGTINNFASVICATLAATTTYYIQVDGFNGGTGGAMGTFCVSVRTLPTASNDCINNATDITSLIAPVNNTTNPFDCNYNYLYSNGTACGSTSIQNVLGDPNYCNGSSTPLVYTPYPDHYDIWFKFTVSSGMPANDYLHLFPLNTNQPFLAMALFGETVSGVPPTSACPGGDISGLTYIDCSSPDVLYLPPPPDPTQGQDGGARDEGACSTPIHARIDISNLPNGTYYVRVWEYAGIENPPSAGYFNLCAETSLPSWGTDGCPGGNIGYSGPDANVDVNNTFLAQSNAGMHGNACNTDPNEPQLAAAPAGQARNNCAGAWITYIGGINNVINNTVIYSFTVAACTGCEPTALVRLSNVFRDGTPGNVAQLSVLAPWYCNNSANPQAIMNGAVTGGFSCIEMRPANNAPLPSGTYSLVVDGQDGQLLQFDLTLILNYPCEVNTNPAGDSTCIAVFPITLVSFTGVNANGANQLDWVTVSETNNDYFVIEKSSDAINFSGIKYVDGAGNSNTEVHYRSFDNEPFQGATYYRLKQIDFDGKYSYSNVIAINNSASDNLIANITTDANGNIVINYLSKSSQPAVLKISDMTGKLLHLENININSGSGRMQISGADISRGIYLMEIVGRNISGIKNKFVKM